MNFFHPFTNSHVTTTPPDHRVNIEKNKYVSADGEQGSHDRDQLVELLPPLKCLSSLHVMYSCHSTCGCVYYEQIIIIIVIGEPTTDNGERTRNIFHWVLHDAAGEKSGGAHRPLLRNIIIIRHAINGYEAVRRFCSGRVYE